MRIVVTGSAGFIGAAVALRLLERGDEVLGIDNLNDYYDVSLKQARLDRLRAWDGFGELRMDLEDARGVLRAFADFAPDRVAHMAAQAGVRYSLERPDVYVSSNVTGFLSVLEACRHHPVEHLVYASSSSVYGNSASMPFSVNDAVDHPISLYAATKKANELMAHTYSHLFGLPATGLRFFTVYGPWGRPDMSPFQFARRIFAGEPIDVYNHGKHQRDFTYIDDIVEGVVRVIDRPAQPDPDWRRESPRPGSSSAPWRLYNIGGSRPVELLRYIEVMEACIGRKAELNMLPLQPGDVIATCADVDDLARDVGYRPDTPLETGMRRFIDWYRDYYGV